MLSEHWRPQSTYNSQNNQHHWNFILLCIANWIFFHIYINFCLQYLVTISNYWIHSLEFYSVLHLDKY